MPTPNPFTGLGNLVRTYWLPTVVAGVAAGVSYALGGDQEFGQGIAKPNIIRGVLGAGAALLGYSKQDPIGSIVAVGLALTATSALEEALTEDPAGTPGKLTWGEFGGQAVTAAIVTGSAYAVGRGARASRGP